MSRLQRLRALHRTVCAKAPGVIVCVPAERMVDSLAFGIGRIMARDEK